MRNLYHDPGEIFLRDFADLTADGNSKYIDALALEGLTLEIEGLAVTADSDDYMTPRVYGYTGSAPGTASGYTELTAGTDYDGTLSAINSTGHFHQKIGLLQKNYRYYYVKLDCSIATAVSFITGVKAKYIAEKGPSEDVTPTTGSCS